MTVRILQGSRGPVTSGRARVLCRVQVKPEVQAERPLLAERDSGSPSQTFADEGEVLRDATSGDHAHVGGGFVGPVSYTHLTLPTKA